MLLALGDHGGVIQSQRSLQDPADEVFESQVFGLVVAEVLQELNPVDLLSCSPDLLDRIHGTIVGDVQHGEDVVGSQCSLSLLAFMDPESIIE